MNIQQAMVSRDQILSGVLALASTSRRAAMCLHSPMSMGLVLKIRHHNARIDRALSVAFVVLGRGLELRCVQVLEEITDRTVSMDCLIRRESSLTELVEPRILLASCEPRTHAQA